MTCFFMKTVDISNLQFSKNFVRHGFKSHWDFIIVRIRIQLCPPRKTISRQSHVGHVRSHLCTLLACVMTCYWYSGSGFGCLHRVDVGSLAVFGGIHCLHIQGQIVGNVFHVARCEHPRAELASTFTNRESPESVTLVLLDESGSSRVAAQLAASQEGLSSVNEWVSGGSHLIMQIKVTGTKLL
jgi:hypothetical protein